MSDKCKIFLASLLAVIIIYPVSDINAASLSFYTKTKNYKVGEQFSTSFYLASLDKSVNAMSATLIYPTKMLDLIDVSTAGTESRFWIEQPKVENTGAVKVQWLILNPGYIGKGAKILTLTFKAKAVGSAPVFVKDVQVLANDGKGTPVKTSASGILFSIAKTALIPKVLGESVRARTMPSVINSAKETVPGTPDHSSADRISPNLSVSIWQNSPSDWPILKYGANDAASGIDHYEISLDNGVAKRFDKAGALMLGNINKGLHVLRVVVYDKAGNQAGDSKSFDYQPK